MLTKIEKIDGLGVFDQYIKQNDLADFSRFNILYGLNGSGKTTLSCLLSYLNNGGSETYPSLKYTIDSAEGKIKEGQVYTRKIRVFNSDYVDANIGSIEGPLNPIFIVGEENKSLIIQIQDDEKVLQTLEAEHDAKEKEKTKLEKERGKKFTEVAQQIASETSGQVTRNYRKPNAEKAFGLMKAEKILNDAELKKHRSTLRQISLESVHKLTFDVVVISDEVEGKTCTLTDAVTSLEQKTKDVLKETSDSQAIQRLREKPDIANWVEQGLKLHKTHNSSTCEYCTQTIPLDRVNAFAKHFNNSDLLLKQRVETVIGEVDAALSSLQSVVCPSKAQLYSELQGEYETAIKSFNSAKKALTAHLQKICNSLKDKLQRRTESVPYTLGAYDLNGFDEFVVSLNTIIDTHNQKTGKFEEHAKNARIALETHCLSTIKNDISEFDKNLKKIDDRLNIISNGDSANGTLGVNALNSRISENRQKVSNTAQAAVDLTNLLQTFLGRDDLKFEPEGDGYRIMRGSAVAKRLSEGEKTAITFIYFIVQLGDQDFDINEGIVVIDDPVSSLDSNSVYQAFSFLKNSVKDAKQIFLFTHNFDFLKLLLNWCKHIPKADGKKSYYMLLCSFDAYGKRKALIQPLDKELLQNENEYSYLFKQLYQFQSDGTIAGSYHIPNVARKVLETFLDFYYTGSETLYRKLERVDFDQNKKTALLKFANDLSHPTGKGFDPALVPETQKNVRYLIEMIRTVSPIHFQSLEKSIK